MANQITKKEVHTRLKYILFGIFAGMTISPVKDFLTNLGISPFMLGIAGMAIVLYYYEF